MKLLNGTGIRLNPLNQTNIMKKLLLLVLSTVMILSSCDWPAIDADRDVLFNVPIQVTAVSKSPIQSNTYKYRIDGKQCLISSDNAPLVHHVSLYTSCDTFKVNDIIYPTW